MSVFITSPVEQIFAGSDLRRIYLLKQLFFVERGKAEKIAKLKTQRKAFKLDISQYSAQFEVEEFSVS